MCAQNRDERHKQAVAPTPVVAEDNKRYRQDSQKQPGLEELNCELIHLAVSIDPKFFQKKRRMRLAYLR